MAKHRVQTPGRIIADDVCAGSLLPCCVCSASSVGASSCQCISLEFTSCPPPQILEVTKDLHKNIKRASDLVTTPPERWYHSVTNVIQALKNLPKNSETLSSCPTHFSLPSPFPFCPRENLHIGAESHCFMGGVFSFPFHSSVAVSHHQQETS